MMLSSCKSQSKPQSSNSHSTVVVVQFTGRYKKGVNFDSSSEDSDIAMFQVTSSKQPKKDNTIIVTGFTKTVLNRTFGNLRNTDLKY